jgi:CubicO group peptidase (beta-lactamase class C family)
MKNVFYLLVFILGVTQAEAQAVTTCNELLAGYKDFGFTGVALVKSHGQTVCQGTMGLKDFGGQSAISPSDHFLIGSVTKQFTAVAILLMQQRGQLDISDSISKYFPKFPSGNQIQIRHLLSHTSGVAEITNTQLFDRLRITPFTDLTPLIDEIIKLPSDFSPGSRWSYSNSNYILLSQIVKIVSGKPWQDFIQTEILNPLHLDQTSFSAGKTPQLVSGHQFNRDYLFTSNAPAEYNERGWANGAGGLESTVDDLALWNASLFSGKLIPSDLVALMSTSQATIDSHTTYGFGLFQRSDFPGEKVIFHSGGIPGFTSMNIYLPERDLSVVVLSNSFDGLTASKMAMGLLKIMLGQSADLPSLNEVFLPIDQLSEKVGTYEFSDLGLSMSVRFENGNLYASLNSESEYKLIPNSRSIFLHRAFNLKFTFSADSNTVTTDLDGSSHIGLKIKK